MSALERAVRGLACRRCGGALAEAAHPDLLRCTYCDTGHLLTQGSDVEARAPAGRLGRRRAQRALADALRERGIRGHAIERSHLVWLPFWQVEAKLVGWLRYRKQRDPQRAGDRRGPDGERLPLVPSEAETVEETIARDVTLSVPACDVRGFGLVGIADRLRSMRLRPFHVPEGQVGETACAVALSRRSALRRTELFHASRVGPRGAIDVRHRISLVRPRLRLLYYPVWRLEYRVRGVAHEAVVDGVRGRLLRGTASATSSHDAGTWLAVAAGGGWLSGVSPVLAAAAWAGWLLHRGSRDGVHGGWRDWAGWIGRQLDPQVLGTVRLDDTMEEST